MSSIVINIAEEFLRSPSPQIRKNSLAALAVDDEEESAKLIAESALTDEDWTVRQRAKSDLLYRLASDPVIPDAVEDILTSALKSDDVPKQKRAYGILGQLKSRGFHVPQVRIKLGNRMWLANTLYFSHYSDRNWSFLMRKWRSGLIGALIGTIPLMVYVRTYFASVSTYLIAVALLIVCVSFLGMLISLFATQFLTPISLHLRRVSASVVQVVVTFLTVLLGTLILHLLLVIVANRFSPFSLDRFGFLILVFSFVAAFARLGSILTFGQLKFLKRLSIKTRNLIAETLGGTAFGFAIATVIYFLMDLALPYDRPFLKSVWLACLSIAMGLAAAFASIDTEPPPVK